ncbi:low choriolytic enzyme-like [Lampris incognitus]|uniref:low choriolytic enzyme-like n=1 Tax=Lampris incognitus TaxID=2546036 RepID=UPI0024B60573|nr:low choriolytic enzyme-like [Lampris incognitus]
MDLRGNIPLLLPLLLGLSPAYLGTDVVGQNEIPVNETHTAHTLPTILELNEGSPYDLLEGDLLIPKTRNAMKCATTYNCFWPKSPNGKVEVPFILSTSYDSSEKDSILKAMADFHSKTCIRFIPRWKQTVYLSIEPRFGCFSTMGRIGDKQVVSLQKFGCIRHGIIQHELLHALGFYHEHTRPDRDQYVRINWEYVRDYTTINFQKKDSNIMNMPYDYASVMHYERSAFSSVYGKETITPIPDPTVAIGQRDGMSKLDIIKVNTIYKCCNSYFHLFRISSTSTLLSLQICDHYSRRRQNQMLLQTADLVKPLCALKEPHQLSVSPGPGFDLPILNSIISPESLGEAPEKPPNTEQRFSGEVKPRKKRK